ncbi:hypothetical protein EYC84_008633 [Monilinia fructicola]|uniref:Uncharacterized protein n=1 Tax=Monilinia fructicola TaxID=38448 RepID=A0A5M9JIS0_MONFR|nr:hypothetical protein EYC84_008633 [Monilinia fructicola]
MSVKEPLRVPVVMETQVPVDFSRSLYTIATSPSCVNFILSSEAGDTHVGFYLKSYIYPILLFVSSLQASSLFPLSPSPDMYIKKYVLAFSSPKPVYYMNLCLSLVLPSILPWSPSLTLPP